jgi:hypothetical protein
MERVIKQLEEKRNTFIGSLKDQITIAKTEGFKKGLDYAIEVLKIQIQQDELSEQECKHLSVKREDGLDECLDCGTRNY